MEEYTKEEEQLEEETESTEIKRWFQDNLRIIVSIIIVIAIAGGIYSYSKRSESPSVTDESVSTEKTTDEAAITVEPANGADQTKNTEEKTTPAKTTPSEVKQATPESKETDSSFVETAGRGDSKTVLARRALANYLEKNPDSALTKEHKIYVEDYLRKQTPSKGVAIGSSLDFSKDSIVKAIELSKKLSDKQLKNLQKYSARVSSL
jgi:FtsZ-interacting cell division protein ZipA